MSKRKRQHDISSDESSLERPSHSNQQRPDPTYGQRSAIPGLDGVQPDADGGTVSFEALEYLRSVR